MMIRQIFKHCEIGQQTIWTEINYHSKCDLVIMEDVIEN